LKNFTYSKIDELISGRDTRYESNDVGAMNEIQNRGSLLNPIKEPAGLFEQ